MKKKCQTCGKEFEAQQPHYRFCTSCNKPPGNKLSLSSDLLLKSYYDMDCNLKREVFIDIPEQLATIFANDNPQLARKQLKDFQTTIALARNRSNLKGIGLARAILYKCQADLEYQANRGVIPKSFLKFMVHHLSIAATDEKNLEGFYQHLDCVQCYFPIKK
jgi:hypothetical protein